MDLSTTYLGLKLEHPLVPSASPLSYSLDKMRRLEDAGASAIVMHSLFEEQIDLEARALDHYLSYGTHSYAEALSYFPEPQDYNLGPDEYLELVRAAKKALDIPVIASLNGVSSGGWTEYARLIEEAGADALELNLYQLPTRLHVSGAEVEAGYLDTVEEVREVISIPLAVKLSPYFSALANMALTLERAGVDGIVLFNRFYQPDFDLETLEVVPNLHLSDSSELRLPLRWIAILHGRLSLDLALSSGVHTHEDTLKGLMAGASVTMMASALLEHGLSRLRAVLADMTAWLEQHEYESVAQLQGSMSLMNVQDASAFERANYMKVLQSWRPDPSGVLR
jgi:dihydroorotate dehydrogenase (fumarate)